MHMKIFVPKSYSELTAAQSRWMFRTLAKNPELNSVEFKTFAFLRFAGLHVITKDYESGDFLIKLGRSIFRIDAAQIAGAIRHLDWTLFPRHAHGDPTGSHGADRRMQTSPMSTSKHTSQ